MSPTHGLLSWLMVTTSPASKGGSARPRHRVGDREYKQGREERFLQKTGLAPHRQQEPEFRCELLRTESTQPRRRRGLCCWSQPGTKDSRAVSPLGVGSPAASQRGRSPRGTSSTARGGALDAERSCWCETPPRMSSPPEDLLLGCLTSEPHNTREEGPVSFHSLPPVQALTRQTGPEICNLMDGMASELRFLCFHCALGLGRRLCMPPGKPSILISCH